MIHVTTLKKRMCTILLCATAFFNHLYTITTDHLLLATTCTAAAYIGLNMYGDLLYNQAHTYYAPLRTRIPICYDDLLKFILQEHDQWQRVQGTATSSYKNYPLIWYIDQLERSLDNMTYAQTFNLCSSLQGRNALINDLHTIRTIIISHYDYIKERRLFDYRYEQTYG